MDDTTIDSKKVQESSYIKFLGLWMDKDLNWKRHTSLLINKIKRNTTLLRNTRNIFDKSTLKLKYYAHIHSHITYGFNVWGGMVPKEVINKIQKVQNMCLSMMEQSQKTAITTRKEHILNISSLIHLEHLKLGYRLLQHTLPSKIALLLSTDQKNNSLEKIHKYDTRNKNKPNLPQIKNKTYRNSFLYQTNKEIMLLSQKSICPLKHHS